MFRDLWQDGAGEPAAGNDAPDSANAAAPLLQEPAPGRGRGGRGRNNRGRGRGFRRDPAEHHLRRERRLAASVRQRDSDVAAMQTTMAGGGKAEQVSKTSFGFTAATRRGANGPRMDCILVDGELFDVKTAVDKQRRSKLQRGIVSHVQARRKCVHDLFEATACPGGAVFSLYAIDDANMWLCNKVKGLQGGVGRGKGSRRGERNVHMPVLSSVAHLIACKRCGRPDREPILSGMEMHTPCVPLPATNWATIRSRWVPWAPWTAAGVGRFIEFPPGDERSIGALASALPLIVEVLVKDAASQNVCIVADEQMRLAELNARDPHRPRLLYEENCLAHQACLATRPAGLRLGKVTTILTRLAHLLESSRNHRNLLEAVEQLAAEAVYKRVQNLSGEVFVARRRRHAAILHTTCKAEQGAGLSPEQQTFVLDVLNGDWTAMQIEHFCPFDCVCGGTSRQAQVACRKAARICFEGGMCVPLQYRWKHMERACAFAARGLLMHNLLPRALGKMWKDKACEEAEMEMQARAERGEEVSFSVKQAVRAKSVNTFFKEACNCNSVLQLHTISAPLQSFLNASFKAEQTSAVFLEQVVRGIGTDAEFTKRKLEAFHRNAQLLSGVKGLQCASKYFAMILDFSHPGWKEVPLAEGTVPSTAMEMVTAMADTWRRLVWKRREPKRRILSVTWDEGCKPSYDDSRVDKVIKELQDMREACDSCLDPEFTVPVPCGGKGTSSGGVEGVWGWVHR